MHHRVIQIAITVVALGAALVHVYLPELKVDGITVTLVFLAALPWLAPLFRSVELPGGLKVEFQDLEAVKRKAEESGLVEPGADTRKPQEDRHIYAYEAVAGSDPNLALAGLRIEIETRLREIAKSQGLRAQGMSLHRLTRDLENMQALSHDEVSAIADLLPLLSSAAHGAQVDQKASEWALDFGPRLLDALGDRAGEGKIAELLEQWRNRDGAAVAEVGTELSKAFVSAPRSFLKAMRGEPALFDAWLKDLEHHTFTIFESRSEVDDDLYLAHYDKLKQLLQRSAERMVNSEYCKEAMEVIDALGRVEVRRIW